MKFNIDLFILYFYVKLECIEDRKDTQANMKKVAESNKISNCSQ